MLASAQIPHCSFPLKVFTTRTMVDIPPEIWLNIPNYIPPHELLNLISINSFRLDAALNERYKRVNLCIDLHALRREWSGRSTLRNIERIRYVSFESTSLVDLCCNSDPVVSRHVRSLYISPLAVPVSDLLSLTS